MTREPAIDWYDRCQTVEADLMLAEAEIERLRAAHTWQNICLAYQGDTRPCATPCLHCSRISAALEPKP
jgi:hypothetical protein